MSEGQKNLMWAFVLHLIVGLIFGGLFMFGGPWLADTLQQVRP